jgi:hypothetical protein
MSNYPAKVYRQAVVVLNSSSQMLPDPSPSPYEPTVHVMLNATGFMDVTPTETQTLILTTFSSVPVILESELRQQEYQELGTALSEMTKLEDGDEWKIDPPVYNAACYVAAGLMANSFPAPRIFNHGAKSVVFNWSDDDSNNMYLTVSADHISALISSPERIKRRLEYSVNELRDPSVAFLSMSATYFKKPVQRQLTGAVSDPTEFVG